MKWLSFYKQFYGFVFSSSRLNFRIVIRWAYLKFARVLSKIPGVQLLLQLPHKNGFWVGVDCVGSGQDYHLRAKRVIHLKQYTFRRIFFVAIIIRKNIIDWTSFIVSLLHLLWKWLLCPGSLGAFISGYLDSQQ